MPGGLARVMDPAMPIVNQTSGLAKDVWVLDDATAPAAADVDAVAARRCRRSTCASRCRRVPRRRCTGSADPPSAPRRWPGRTAFALSIVQTDPTLLTVARRRVAASRRRRVAVVDATRHRRPAAPERAT